ncbi:WecB/TagA/CpsF family glycosyltransferase [uncultured Methylobacterium sp.]|uniref:WecB/TagA/CpsF family glycosyltransferase n=1 Tax=uncultured Methylobacterium sp. TaxID=157278 RepID=UPI0035CB86DF
MSFAVDPICPGHSTQDAVNQQISFLDLDFDRLDLTEALVFLLSAHPQKPFRYLVTPNVDHMLRVNISAKVAQLYRDAWLCINDSRVLSLLARMIGVDLPATPGSDLVAALLTHPDLDRSTPILIVGGTTGLGTLVAERCGLTGVTQIRPPMGLRDDPVALAKTVSEIEAVRAQFMFIAVGSPQQEMIAAALSRGGQAHGIGLCIGVGLEFLVGERRRAPAIMQAAGLEWLFRLACEPRRLCRRYLVDGPRIVWVVLNYARSDRWRRSRAA